MASAARIDWEAAFAYYAELGWQRRYAAVAERYSVSLTGVKEHARRNGWQTGKQFIGSLSTRDP